MDVCFLVGLGVRLLSLEALPEFPPGGQAREPFLLGVFHSRLRGGPSMRAI